MARRTLLHYKMDVYRECSRQVEVGLIQQAIQDAIDFIDSKANWEFLIASANLSLNASYSTGTVAIAKGSTSVAGTGTTWDPTWQYKELRSARPMYYDVASFGGAAAATLKDPCAADVAAGSSYVIAQSRYALPADCEGGRDICIKGPQGTGARGTGWIYKIPRMLHEKRVLESSPSGNLLWYTDDELDESSNVPTIRFYPMPTTDTEVRVLYYKHMTKPLSDGDFIPIPIAFEKLIVHKAAQICMEKAGMKGWMGQEAHVKTFLEDLFDRYAASPGYVLEIEADDGYPLDSYGAGRVVQGGMLYNFGG